MKRGPSDSPSSTSFHQPQLIAGVAAGGAKKRKEKEVQFECDRCGSFVLMCVLCGSFRRRGDRDEGGPGAVQHAAWEGVWRAGYSLQLHQDGHCQE